MKLDDIKSLKNLYKQNDIDQLKELAFDIRNFLNEFVNKNKGHIGSNLGVVELTITILSFFNMEKTILLFDTGHQSHVFKLLIHGKEKFSTLKKFNGLSNFQEVNESPYDWISNGHSSTSLAYQYGYALASDKENIISVIGDAAFIGAYTLPGLINLQNSNKKSIIILNDNNESIGVNPLKIFNIKQYIESLGITYLKCENGNDFAQLFSTFENLKEINNNVFIHCITKKALGYNGKYPLFENHSVEAEIKNSYSKLIAEELEKYFTDQDFFICPAMLNSSNFTKLKQKFKNNVIDVGINEEFSVVLASAINNCKKTTYLSIFSTFFQRVFDQLIHDVFRNNNNINFLLDRGGLSFGGGVSHHGIYDIFMVNNIKNAIICQPYSINDVKVLVKQSYLNKTNPFFLRYENLPAIDDGSYCEFKIGEWQEIIYKSSNKITLISYGSVLNEFKEFIENNHLKINLINARYINPIDDELINKHKNNFMFVYEQVININNLFSNIKNKYNDLKIFGFAFDKIDIKHGEKNLVLKDLKMDIPYIIKKIFEVYDNAGNSK